MPVMTVAIHAARNRLVDAAFQYDNNGNLTRIPRGPGRWS